MASADLWMFGTTQSEPPATTLTAGRLKIAVRSGSVCGLFWEDREVVRAIDYPIRDVDWGTLATTDIDSRITEHEGRIEYERTFRATGFSGSFRFVANASGRVELGVRLTAEGRQTICRAGFVVLHPLDLAGEPLTVHHTDGSAEATAFPVPIKPSQPAMDITRMVHRAGTSEVDIAFIGDIFEMEDQRNWSDASYKTYCRPLLRPYPYEIEDGAVIEQSIVVTLSTPQDAQQHVRSQSADFVARPIPAFGLAMDPAWPTDGAAGSISAVLPGLRALVRVDAARPADREWLAANHFRDRSVDLEIVVDQNDPNLDGSLRQVRSVLSASDVVPDHVIVLPRAFLRCIQPWEPAPAGISLECAANVARSVFPRSRIGIGVLTNFVELNRARPAGDGADYVTHSLTPLVHAADDVSVMATLDTLVPIAASIEAIYPEHALRLGLASIGMRTNPYGAGVAANPQHIRVAMAGDDPRQRGLFGAAFMVGLAASPLAARSEFIALGSAYGPFGLIASHAGWALPGIDGTRSVAFPALHAFRALASLAGHPRRKIALPPGVRGLAAARPEGKRLVAANCTDRAIDVHLEAVAQTRRLDATTVVEAATSLDWTTISAATAADTVQLGPYEILVADFVGRQS